MSDGLGSLKAFNASTGGQKLYEIVAPSTTITNLGTETTFSNGTYTIPANFLLVGDVIRIHAKTFLIAVNSTNTHRVRAYVGSTTLADSGAVAMIANDVVIMDITMTIRTITASGTFIADGVVAYSINGTYTSTPFTVASTTIDSTVTQAITIKSLASATSTGNQIRLDEMEILLDRAGLPTVFPMVQAAEALANATGSPAFIRGWVL